MAAEESILAIKGSVVGGGEFGREIGAQGNGISVQGGPDDLFDAAVVQVYARPKAHSTVAPKRKGLAVSAANPWNTQRS
jgi:hypothetical protein